MSEDQQEGRIPTWRPTRLYMDSNWEPDETSPNAKVETRAGNEVKGTKEDPFWVDASYVVVSESKINEKTMAKNPHYRGKVDLVVSGRYYEGCYYRNSEQVDKKIKEGDDDWIYDVHQFIEGVKPEGYYHIRFKKRDILPSSQRKDPQEVLEILKKDPQAFFKKPVRI